MDERPGGGGQGLAKNFFHLGRDGHSVWSIPRGSLSVFARGVVRRDKIARAAPICRVAPVNSAGITFSSIAGRFVQITRGGDVGGVDIPAVVRVSMAPVPSPAGIAPQGMDGRSLFDDSMNGLFA